MREGDKQTVWTGGGGEESPKRLPVHFAFRSSREFTLLFARDCL